MPIMTCTTKSGKKGFKWGEKGKCYPNRAQAIEQMKAIKASQAKKKG